MSETFEKWWDNDFVYSESGSDITEYCKDYSGDAWLYQQAKIDQLEKKCAEYEEALSSVRKIIKYPWSVFEPPLVAIEIVDKALNKYKKGE